MKKTPYVIVALMSFVTSLAVSEEPVHFPDANLKQAVEDNLLVNNPTPSHMLLLVWFDGYEYNITDLTGLEYATNLEWLDLAYNNINEISPLSELTGLYEIYLENNEIVDISALSELTNLEILFLNNNNIRDISALSKLRLLFDLDLGNNQISDISALSELTRLGNLLLNNNLISDISGISDLNGMYYLDLSSNPLNDDAYNIHIPRIIENNPGIEIYYDPQTAARLIVTSANGGSVTRPGEGTFDYNYGDIVVIEATADHGYTFASWTGSAVDNGKVTNPDATSTTVTVDGNYTLQATFLRSDGGVYFPDPNLQACVEHALGISNPTPTDMLLLTQLNSEDLPGKIITDLTGLEYATNLTELDLYDNHINELSALSELTDLTILDLGSNEIDEISPLAGLTKLTDLFLNDNQIWDISPLSGLTNLKGLDISVNWIDSISPLSNLKNLVWLGLEESEVYDISPLSQLNNLRELYLGWNYIEDVSALSGLTNLSVLDLSCNTDDAYYSAGELDISPLVGLTNLTYLNLEQNYIYDISPLSELTNLEYLNLCLTEAWDISPLSRLHNLEWLDLESNFVDDISPLAGLATLKHLNLKMNFIISNISALSQVPSMEWVDLSQNDVNDISALLNLSHLERVLLWGNPLTDEACLQVQELINRGVIVLCKCGVQVHILTISSTSGGSVTEPGEGSFHEIVHGTTMAIEATADPDCYFVNWTGTAVDAGKVTDPCSPITTVIVDGNYTLQANFASTNNPPDAPTLVSPADGSSTWSVPIFQLFAADADNDQLKFKIEVMRNGVPILTFDQTQNLMNWNNTEYYSGEMAAFTLPESQSLGLGIHEWRACVFDGACWSTLSQTQAFDVIYQQPICSLTIYDNTIIDTELEERSGYSILVPSSTTSGVWRSTFLFSNINVMGIGGLDSYDIRVQRYRNAFVAAMMQPELTQRLMISGYGNASLRDLATLIADKADAGSDLAELASILRSGQGVFDLSPNSIQTTLMNWQQVVDNKHLSQSLDDLSEKLKAVGFVAHISADVLDDIFLHAIANAMVLERMECLEDFINCYSLEDTAIESGFILARQDVNEFLEQDVSVIQSTINSFQSHAGDYIIRGSAFLPAIAQHYGIISNALAASIRRLVLPWYWAYGISVDLFADIEDMQSMCAAATLNSLLHDRFIMLETESPDPTDPSYKDTRRLLLTTLQIRYGLGYWFHAKYDQILNLNILNPAEFITLLIQNIIGTYSDIAAYRNDVLHVWMDNNYNYTIGINPCLGYYNQEPPQ